MVGDASFREVSSQLWSVAARLEAMDAAGIGIQVLSPVPILLCYWAERDDAAVYFRALNDSLARDVAQAPDRLCALGAVPLQHPDLAVEELRYVMTTLGMRGVEIGSSIEGVDLDDPSLRPFWRAAEELGAVVLVHPMGGGGGVVRRSGQPYDFGMGMLTDTAMAAAAVVFGGVLEEFVDLKIVMVHGCGAFAWLYPRMSVADVVWSGGDATAAEERVRSLWVDTMVFDPEHLRLLMHRFGSDKVVVGTDHPFFPDVTHGLDDFLEAAAEMGAVDRAHMDSVRSDNARALLGLDG